VRILSSRNLSSACGFQHRLALLIEKALVRRAAALGDEEKFVGVSGLGEEGRSAPAGLSPVLTSSYIDSGGQLAVAQIGFGIAAPGCRQRVEAASSPSVQMCCPFLPMTMAVPVSWHIGSTPAGGDIGRFFNRSDATNLSFAEASGSSRIARKLGEMAGTQEVGGIDEGLGSRAMSAPPGATLTMRPAFERARVDT